MLCAVNSHMSKLSLLKLVVAHIEMLEEPICCSYIFRSLGCQDEFRKNACELVGKIERFAPDVIVNLCPTCNRHFEKHLKREGGLRPVPSPKYATGRCCHKYKS